MQSVVTAMDEIGLSIRSNPRNHSWTCKRVRSVLTQKVNVIEGGEVRIHAGSPVFMSGQRRFLG